ncbi:hypothetical protein EVAR_6762_1 [Eumeta japonica]|uniref:Ig-like domain-containing protein n=1 Tax=Eumeta variegata TaxID=151549 RepID=A0A4C1V5W8_EUMVA|nr:hypothetical protein EVAR_6762_1 [Eumeta japonica]
MTCENSVTVSEAGRSAAPAGTSRRRTSPVWSAGCIVRRGGKTTCCARGRPIIVEWERDARHSAGLSLVRISRRGIYFCVICHPFKRIQHSATAGGRPPWWAGAARFSRHLFIENLNNNSVLQASETAGTVSVMSLWSIRKESAVHSSRPQTKRLINPSSNKKKEFGENTRVCIAAFTSRTRLISIWAVPARGCGFDAPDVSQI